MRLYQRGMLIILSICMLASCDSRRIVGNGQITTEQRELPMFSHIQVLGSIELNIKQGDAQSLSVQADSNVIPVVITKVENGHLIISTKSGVIFSTKHPIIVNIVAKQVLQIQSSGANQIKVTGLKGEGLNLSFNGSSEAKLIGQVKQVSYNLVGTAHVDAKKLQSDIANVHISGASELSLSVSKLLSAKISGVGNVIYYGEPQVNQEVYGLGKLIQRKSDK